MSDQTPTQSGESAGTPPQRTEKLPTSSPAAEAAPAPPQSVEPTVRRRRFPWRLAIGAVLVLAAGAHYIKTGYRLRAPVEIGRNPDPIRMTPDLKPADRVPAEAGELAGSNVLLVTLDTTRADRLGCYGNKSIQTPALDRLAHEGVAFSEACAAAPSTLPAHSSILTGLYPAHHGSRVNGLYRLDAEHVTLAEVLADRGYTTGAVIAAYVLDSSYGLDQGFQHYDDDLSDCADPRPYAYKERPGDQTTARAVHWLQGVGDSPFFLWVHYFDPHMAYAPPSPYAEQYKDNPYDGEIAFVDAQIGGLLATLDALGLTERTLVVVVGDHGESLGQHNELNHAVLLYEATLRVPLLMRCGQRLGGGVQVSRRVSQVDLVPTILSLLGLPAPERTDGVDLLRAETHPRAIYAETLHGLMLYGWAALLAVYDGTHKYVHGPVPELFDLTKDPNELKNLYKSNNAVATALKQKLSEVFGPDLDLAEVAAPTHAASMSDLEKLRALGYVGAVANIPAPGARSDPKDMMPAMLQMDWIVFNPDPVWTHEKKIARLKDVAEKYPKFHPLHRYLGDLYRALGQTDEAIEAYTKSMELCPDPTTLYCLAFMKAYKGETEAAEALFREIISRYPDHLQARYLVGVLAGQAGRYDEAAAAFKYVFDSDCDFEQAGMQPGAIQLVQAYVLAGRTEELPAILRPRLASNPRSAYLRGALAAYHAARKEYAEANTLLREGLALNPQDRKAITNLATFLVSCPDPNVRRPYEGVAMMERLCESTQYQQPELLQVLSILYSAVGRLDEGVAMAERAQNLATQAGKLPLVQELNQLLAQQKQMKAGGGPTPTPTPTPPTTPEGKNL